MSTIFDIAKEAGVSITTVSRALNGYSDVSEKTRQRIVQIARDLNYYPSAAARSLQGKRTNTIAFATMLSEHVESEPFFKEFLGVLALSSFRHDLSLLAVVMDAHDRTGEVYKELAGTGRVDGIILADIKPTDERMSLLQSLNVPFIAFGRTNDYLSLRYPLVDVDGAAGIRSVVDYLYEKGHRSIAYLSGPFDTSYALHRHSGYKGALEAHGLALDRELVIGDLQKHNEIERAVDSLLALPRNIRPTSIVCANDNLALQVLYRLDELNIPTRGDLHGIAVTGFDDLPFAAYVQPSLTTVRQPIRTICDLLLDMLAGIIDGSTGEMRSSPRNGVTIVGPMQALVEPELVSRDSA